MVYENGIFFHIAKTAGTSQINILQQYNNINVSNIYFTNKMDLDISQINKSFKWTFVRNPFDRLVSIMFAWKWKNINKTLTQLLDLVELGYKIDWKLPDIDQDTKISKLWQNTDFAIIEHIKPMHILTDILKSYNIHIDFIGKYERLNFDWYFIQKKINIKENLPHLNRSNHDTYCRYFKKQKLIDRTVDLYKKDFEYFEYNINPFRKDFL